MTSSVEISCRGLSKQVFGHWALQNFTYTFRKGITYIIGDNGAGKSTLLKLLTTTIRPDSGLILYRQQIEINKSGAGDLVKVPVCMERDRTLPTSRVRAMIGYMPQYFTGYPEMSVVQYLCYEAYRRGIPGSLIRQNITEWLTRAGLISIQAKKLRSLSGGQLRMIGLIQTLMSHPRICLLDEPFEGLDILEAACFQFFIQKLSYYSTILISTHRLEMIDSQGEEPLIVMEHGEIKQY